MGNHDAGRTNYERQVITQQFFKSQYTKQQALDLTKTLFPNYKYSIDESNEIVWEITADNMLFDEVYEGPLMIGEKLILSHEPLDYSWAFNIHGHDHSGHRVPTKTHLNVCSDVIKYTPLNLNSLLKAGLTSYITSIHRSTIDTATKRKQKRIQKKK
jgi:calcineurin-like phosphoesterase family protein